MCAAGPRYRPGRAAFKANGPGQVLGQTVRPHLEYANAVWCPYKNYIHFGPWSLRSLVTKVFFGYPTEVSALFTAVSSIRVSRVRVTLTVTVRGSRVRVVVSVRDSVK